MRKVFVDVVAKIKTDGTMVPLAVTWEDGTVYEVDKILCVRRAASLKAGGMGIRYTCRIAGKDSFLFYEAPKWFMEGK